MGDRHQANATLATETRWHWGQTPYPTILHSLAEANAFLVSILEKPLKELETSANPANKAEVAELTVQLRLLRRSVVETLPGASASRSYQFGERLKQFRSNALFSPPEFQNAVSD